MKEINEPYPVNVTSLIQHNGNDQRKNIAVIVSLFQDTLRHNLHPAKLSEKFLSDIPRVTKMSKI